MRHMSHFYGQVLLIMALFAPGLVRAEVSVPSPADMITEEMNYLSYFFYMNDFSGRVIGGEALAADPTVKQVGQQSVKYTSGWDPGFWTRVGIYSGGAATPWVLDGSYNLALRLRCQGGDNPFWFYVDLEDADGGTARFFNDAPGWTNPTMEIPNDGSWTALLLPLDRFVDLRDTSKNPGDEGYQPPFNLAKLVVAQVRYLDNAGHEFTLWFDDVRFMKNTFDQELPNGDSDAMTDTPKAFGCSGVWSPNELIYPSAWNHADKKVGAYSLELVEQPNRWGGGYVNFGLINGQSEASLWALGGADWYFDGWIKQTPFANKSQLLDLVDADGNMVRKYVYSSMEVAKESDDWAHVYLPLSRLQIKDAAHPLDWNRIRKINLAYFSSSESQVTRLDGWSLVPYQGAYQYPPKWADAFSENFRDHFDLSAITETVGQNMGENGNAELLADTVNKVAGRQSVKMTKAASWGEDSWYYVGVYSGGAETPWRVGPEWRFHAAIRIQGGLETMTRYIEIKDADGNLLRYDVGSLLPHEGTDFVTLELKLSDFTDDSAGAFDYSKVTKALLRLNSPGCTPTIWIDDIYLWTPAPAPPSAAGRWELFN